MPSSIPPTTTISPMSDTFLIPRSPSSNPPESLALLNTGTNCFVFREQSFFQTMNHFATASQVNSKLRFIFAGCSILLEVMAYYLPQNRFIIFPGLHLSQLGCRISFNDTKGTMTTPTGQNMPLQTISALLFLQLIPATTTIDVVCTTASM